MLADNRAHAERIIRKRYKNKMPCTGCQVSDGGTNKIHVLEYRRGTSTTWLELPRRHIAKRRGNGLVLDFHHWSTGSATLHLRWKTFNVQVNSTSAPSGYTEVSGARSKTTSCTTTFGTPCSIPDHPRYKRTHTWKAYLSTTGTAGNTVTVTVPGGANEGCYQPPWLPGLESPGASFTACHFEIRGFHAARVYYTVLPAGSAQELRLSVSGREGDYTVPSSWGAVFDSSSDPHVLRLRPPGMELSHANNWMNTLANFDPDTDRRNFVYTEEEGAHLVCE